MIQLANWLIITNSNNQLFILIILRYIPYQQYFNIIYSLVLFLDLFSTYFVLFRGLRTPSLSPSHPHPQSHALAPLIVNVLSFFLRV